VDAVKLLLKRKAKVNQQDRDGRTLLHVASENGHDTVAQRLIDRRANCHLRDNDHKTALDLAKTKGHQRIVRLLDVPG
jgi:ankyrin repeat protein